MKKLLIIPILTLFLFSCKKEENKTLVDRWKLNSVTKYITINNNGKDSSVTEFHPSNFDGNIFENTSIELDEVSVGKTIWEFTNNDLIKDGKTSYPYHIVNTDKQYIDVQTNPTKRVFESSVFYNDNLVLTTTKQYITGMDGSHKTIYSTLIFDRQ